MKHPCLPLGLSLALLVPALTCQAQPLAPPPAGPASAAPAAPIAKPGPRAMSTDELRNSASFPDDLRPDGRSAPQISVPLGLKPPTPSAAVSRALTQDGAASPTKINDAVARCKGQADAQANAKCARELAARDRGSRTGPVH